MSHRALLPVLMRAEEIGSVKDAMRATRKSDKTVRRLCARHGLARQTAPGAPLEVSLVGIEMAVAGDLDAIELLRAGRRQDERVRRYLRHLGLTEG